MSTQKITISGGNLYSLAAKYLNDATQWIRIAQANGLTDPVLSGVTVIVIPPINKSTGGGVAS
jgi:hypothetical protein